MPDKPETVASTQEACSLHEVGSRIAELKRRCDKAGKLWQSARDEAERWRQEEYRRWKAMTEIEREYMAARESATDGTERPAHSGAQQPETL